MTSEKIIDYISTHSTFIPIYPLWVSPEDADLPFVSITQAEENVRMLKGGSTSTSSLCFHFWSDDLENRDALTKHMDRIARENCFIQTSDGRAVMTKTSRQIVIDTTTSTPYLHGVLFIDYV